VTTLVVSDLHLGHRQRIDALRRPEPLAALVEEVRRADRLVLLGDALELRHGPPTEALAAARPVFAALGDALGADGELVLVPGNHDHELIAGWLDRRAADPAAAPLGLEERIPAAGASPVAAALAEAAAPARLSLAYPGVWLRDDVFALHGHQLDLHVTVPTVERLAAGVMARVLGGPPEHGATPDDYERALAPLYAWTHVVARHTAPGAGTFRQTGSAKAWRDLTSAGPRPLRTRALVLAFPLVIAALGRAGLGELRSDLSPAELRRAGLAAMHETLRRLGVDAAHVLFGHTHRTGPLPGDDPAQWGRLVNTGCWVSERVFIGDAGRRSPYWAGSAVRVGATGPPERFNLL
jgi:hypothetical protein